MAKSKLRRAPHPAKPHSGSTEAWWYEEEHAINIYIRQSNVVILSARISRSALKRWIERTELSK